MSSVRRGTGVQRMPSDVFWGENMWARRLLLFRMFEGCFRYEVWKLTTSDKAQKSLKHLGSSSYPTGSS